MSRLLAVETSSEACSVALAAEGRLYRRDMVEPRRHAELLLPAIREVLTESQTALEDLDAVAFGRGPGSFTSLRIGIGVVQGLAWGAGLGVVPVSSLAAVAQGVIARGGAGPGASLVVAMDARMGEVFHACFTVGETGLAQARGEERVSSPEGVEWPPGDVIVGAGNGFERYPRLMRRSHPFSAVYPRQWPAAADIIPLALDWLASHEPLPPHLAQPVYVRDHVADKPAAGTAAQRPTTP